MLATTLYRHDYIFDKIVLYNIWTFLHVKCELKE